jgi:hypothetical protein
MGFARLRFVTISGLFRFCEGRWVRGGGGAGGIPTCNSRYFAFVSSRLSRQISLE